LYDPAVRESPTLALPAIWQDFDAFLAIAEASESAAAGMAAADDAETFRAAGRSLRAACDACHVRFSRPYTPPEVSQEDLEFDFDSVLPSE
jgi:cytochrome c556